MTDSNDALPPSEATDSDEVANDDGDEVVDPPERWHGADRFGMSNREAAQGESLGDKLQAEQPDISPGDPPRRDIDEDVAEPDGVEIATSDDTGGDDESYFSVIR